MGTEAPWGAPGCPEAVWSLLGHLVPILPGTGQGTYLGEFQSPPPHFPQHPLGVAQPKVAQHPSHVLYSPS